MYHKERIYNSNRIRNLNSNRGEGLYLDKNERTKPYDEIILEDLRKNLCQNLTLYPDIDYYYNIFSKWLGISEEKICFTEGVSGGIRLLIDSYLNENDRIFFDKNTYKMYEIYSNLYNLKITHEFIDNLKMIFLQNVMMPYGYVLDKDKLEKTCEKYKDIPVILDDVYFGFNVDDYIDLIDKYDNLFIMRSFSKAFGLASIRLGYVMSNAKNIGYISKNRNGYETNLISLQIAKYFIDNSHLVHDYINEVKISMKYFVENLKKLEIDFSGGSSGNFIFLKINPKICDIFEDFGIFCRKYENGVRVTIGTEEQMKRIVKILKNIEKEKYEF